MGTIIDHLRVLRDVQGVYGSFVVAGSGSLVDRDLPAAFDETVLAEVGPRVARLFETFVSGGRDMSACMLRYSEHKLYVRKMTWGLIGVLSTSAVNLPALRMVVNLVVRRIDPEIGAIVSTSNRSASNVAPPLPLKRSTVPVAVDPEPGPPVSAGPRTQPSPPREPTPAPPRTSDPDGPVPSGDRPVRMYRGRPVDD
jgi:predicted regulator of Ras-like GTPase activity (Roadblock/LC7/MglB family)